MGLRDRLSHAWNALRDKETTEGYAYPEASSLDIGTTTPGFNVFRRRFSRSEFANTIFNRIALDSSMIDIQHVRIDKSNENQTMIDSGLQNCLSVEANIDQSGREFIHDIVYSMFDEGVVAVVPVDTTFSPIKTGSYDIKTMRVGRITQWYPKHVRVELYNEDTGNKQEIKVPKKMIAIIENPLYAITNSQNSTLQRLLRKLSLLDAADEIASSGKLNMVVQLPYAVKTEKMKKQAEARIENLEAQLNSNKYGVAYIDATEKLTQLNREISSNLFDEVKYLTAEFYNQMGLTEHVFNGTASEAEMRNYYSRAIDPIIDRIVTEFKRKFLTNTARAQGQTLVSYRDPFKLVPVDQVAEIADKFSRNAILTANEVRKIVGFRPSNDPAADLLRNPNIADVNQNLSLAGALPPIPTTGSLTSPETQ